jgi:integrase
MASVFRPSGRRIYRIEFKDQYSHTKTVSSGMMDRRAAEGLASMIERDAERLRAGLLLEHAQHTAVHLGLATVDDRFRSWDEILDDYLAHLQNNGSDPEGKTITEGRRILRRWAKECRWKCLADIRPSHITAYLAAQAQAGRGPVTQNTHLARLNALFTWCAAPGRKWIDTNPAAGIKKIKIGHTGRRHRRRAYSDTELTAILATAPEPRRTVYLVAAYSGIRHGTLRKLEKQDLDPTGPQPRWHIRAAILKNGRPLNVPMLPECAAAIRQRWQQLPAPGTPLFGCNSERKRLKNQKRTVVPHTHTLQEDLLTAHVERQDSQGRAADFHSFRYTFCRLMGERLPIQKVKTLMGHSTIKLTADLYGALGMEDVAEDVWSLSPLALSAIPTAGPTTVEKSA